MLTTLIIIAVFGSQVFATDFTSCSDGSAPINVKVIDCEKQPCIFKRGENISADVEFTVAQNTSSLKAWVQVDVLGTTMNYTVPGQDEACDWLVNSSCPLIEGNDVTYILQMPILPVYPTVWYWKAYDIDYSALLKIFYDPKMSKHHLVDLRHTFTLYMKVGVIWRIFMRGFVLIFSTIF